MPIASMSKTGLKVHERPKKKKVNVTETIKSVTKCPTCGAECTIGGEGETHYYIPNKIQK